MMNKTILCAALGSACISVTTSAVADLSANAWLNFDAGVAGGPYGFIISGSYFGMDADSSGSITIAERTGLSQNEGLFLGITQAASGSHSGAPGCTYDIGAGCNNTGESPSIDAAWNFFGNTGMHQTTSATNVLSATGNTGTIDFSGWSVTWNGVANIPMSGGAHSGGVDAEASITCAVDCAVGDTYILDYYATVPNGDPSGFGDVLYLLHLEGTVGECTGDASAPNAVNDNYDVATDTATSMTIAANDADVGCSGLDKSSVDLDPATAGQQTTFATANGTATVDIITGVVSYTPGAAYQGLDDFSYSISDRAGNPSATTTVNIAVGDLAPTCNDDGVADGAYIDITKDTFVNITVLANDLAGTNTIVPSTVTVISDVSVEEGTTESFADGTITYTPTPGFTGTASFTYNVTDDGGSPLTCADATVNVLVSAAGEPIGGVANAYLVLTSGPVDDVSQQPDLGKGSWFSMETSPGVFTYTPLVGLNHIQLGTEQPALSPDMPNIDSPWTFFGNLGVHQSTGILNQLSNDGAGNAQLDFSVWDVSWNAIPSIPLGDGQDDGIATVTCYTDLLAGTPGTCADGDEYLLTYRAIVPLGDPSGFGGVNYAAHLEGTISATAPIAGCGDTVLYDVDTVSVIGDCTTKPVLSLLPGATATSVGNTTGLYLSASDAGSKDPLLNTADGEQCVGGCLDFVINDVTTGEALLVVNLSAPIPEGAIYRKLVNGRWQDFDVSGVDTIGSAAADAGKCQGPEGVYQIGLRPGNECLFLSITDGGPNDADGQVNGTIVDPSGVLLPGSPNVPASSTGGCSISNTSVKLSERAEWFIVAGFIVWLGLMNYRRKKVMF